MLNLRFFVSNSILLFWSILSDFIIGLLLLGLALLFLIPSFCWTWLSWLLIGFEFIILISLLSGFLVSFWIVSIFPSFGFSIGFSFGFSFINSGFCLTKLDVEFSVGFTILGIISLFGLISILLFFISFFILSLLFWLFVAWLLSLLLSILIYLTSS